ncbi:MAG: ABC transporter substrate-binding protein [Planctomycetales bacterium]|nr:ABC transporter substrate-binding protein [Planctomycetales bacterium]
MRYLAVRLKKFRASFGRQENVALLGPFVVMSAALFGVVLLGGCRGQSASAPADTLIYGRGEDAQSLDPIATDIGESVKVIVNLYDTLVAYDDETLDLVPSLAERWEHSDDGLTWTFHLRPDVLFHDGTPFNAEAVVFTFRRLIDEQPEFAYTQARPYKPNFSNIADVEAIDERTVQFQLREPSAVFLKNIAMFPASIVSPTAVKQHQEAFGANPVGTGPFRFARWLRDEQLVLEAFDEHWRGKPDLARAIFVPVSESATRVSQLKRGEIHIADNLPPAELDALAQTPGIVLQEQTGLNVAYLTMQTEKPPLDNTKVRQAIAHAIDKPRLVDVAYAGHARPAVNMVPPAMWGHHNELKDRPYDVAQAKQLLEEASAEAGFALPLSLTLSVMSQPRPYMQEPLQTASFIKDALAAIGIDVEIQTKPVNQHFDHLMSGGHELGLAGWSSDNNDPDNFLYSLLDSDNIGEHGNNLSRYNNPEVHRLLLAAQSELDDAARLKMYLQAQELIFADAPVVPLVHTQVRIAQRDVLKGYLLHPSNLVRLRLARIEAAP